MNELKSNVDYLTMFGRESEFYIAQDISEYGSKTYYNLSLDDLKEYLQSDYHLYEIIKEDKPCKMYFDFDGKYQDMTEEEKEYFKNNKIPTEIISHLKDFCQNNNLPKPLCILSGSSTETKKSIHITIKNIILPTNQHRKAFFDKFINYIDGKLITGFFDANVYTKNRLMRLINQSKLSKKVPLKSLHKVNLTSHIITYTDGFDITEIPNDWIEQKKECIPRHEDQDNDKDVDYSELRKHLNNISRNETYKDWTLVGQVLLNLTNGDDEGLDMFIDWSRSASNFDYGGCERFWSSNKPNSNYGIGVLINMLDKVDSEPIVRLIPKAEPKVELKSWQDTFIYDISDMYSAEIFAKHCEGEVFFTEGYGWVIFNKQTKFWTYKNEKSSLVYPISKFFSEHMKKIHINFVNKYDPSNETDNKTLKLIMKTSKVVESSKFSKNILDHLQDLLKRDNSIVDNFDNQPGLIAFKNGFVIDLFNEGKSRPITKEDFLITHTGYNIPIRNEYYNKIYDIIRSMVETDDDMNSLLSLLATFIFGENTNEMFFVLTGSGGNGKGVLDKMLQLSLGNYYKTIDIKQLTNYEKDGGTRANSELFNCRLARCVMTSEPESGSNNNKLITSTIKKWTGKDPITCRDLFSKSITYTPKFTLAINVNEIPQLSTKDGGIERRMKCYELPFKFIINNGQELNSKERYRNDDLKRLLATDEYKDQIILVLIDAWLKNKGKFYECEKVAEFTSNYMNEQNPVKEWFFENYELNDTGRMPSTELYNDFRRIGSDISTTSFARYLKEICQSVRNSGTKYKCSKKSFINEI